MRCAGGYCVAKYLPLEHADVFADVGEKIAGSAVTPAPRQSSLVSCWAAMRRGSQTAEKGGE